MMLLPPPLLLLLLLAGDVLASIPVELAYEVNYTWGPQYEVCGYAWRSKTAGVAGLLHIAA
jgi:hypothetical protein